MSTRTRTAAALALVAAAPFLLVACSDDDGPDGAGGIPASADFNASDVRFAARMVPHHEQALEMVEMAEGRDLSPAVADLVEQIGAAQGPEITRMSAWLEQWADVATAAEDEDGDDGDAHGHMDGNGMGGDGMDRDDMDGVMGSDRGSGTGMDPDDMGSGGMGAMGSPGSGAMAMPGMMGPAQLAELEAARGRAFERMWLATMVQHHEGAIEMAQDELEHGEDADALALARSIADSQQAEVEEMRALLDR